MEHRETGEERGEELGGEEDAEEEAEDKAAMARKHEKLASEKSVTGVGRVKEEFMQEKYKLEEKVKEERTGERDLKAKFGGTILGRILD